MTLQETERKEGLEGIRKKNKRERCALGPPERDGGREAASLVMKELRGQASKCDSHS